MTPTSYDQLSDLEKSALGEAENTLKNAYTPYSHFNVAACLTLKTVN